MICHGLFDLPSSFIPQQLESVLLHLSQPLATRSLSFRKARSSRSAATTSLNSSTGGKVLP